MSQNDHHPRHSHRPRLLKLEHPSNISRALPIHPNHQARLGANRPHLPDYPLPLAYAHPASPPLHHLPRRPSAHHRLLNHSTPFLAHPPHPRPIRLHPHAPTPRPHAPNDFPPSQRVLQLPPRPAHAAIQHHGIIIAFPLLWAPLAPSASASVSASASSSLLDPESAPASRASRSGPRIHLSGLRMRARTALGCRRGGWRS